MGLSTWLETAPERSLWFESSEAKWMKHTKSAFGSEWWLSQISFSDVISAASNHDSELFLVFGSNQEIKKKEKNLDIGADTQCCWKSEKTRLQFSIVDHSLVKLILSLSPKLCCNQLSYTAVTSTEGKQKCLRKAALASLKHNAIIKAWIYF